MANCKNIECIGKYFLVFSIEKLRSVKCNLETYF
jgi:hypothetical protein